MVVELVALEEVDLSSAPKLARCYGCLGLLELGNGGPRLRGSRLRLC